MKNKTNYKLLNPKDYKILHGIVHKNFLKKTNSILCYNKIKKILPLEISTFLKGINKHKFHVLKFYIVELLDEYLVANELVQDKLQEELIDYWSESEYAKDFFEKLNQNSSVLKSSVFCQKKLLNQISIFIKVHFEHKNISSKTYNPVIEIGDYRDANGKLHSAGFGEVRSLDLENGYYPYLSFLTADKKNSSKHLKQITRALSVIKNYSASSYQAFAHFSHTIIPIKDREIVSYSLSKLPGYSMINLYHRDFIDLLDDLIHENGHHYLNYLLNSKSLIIEDLDKIFYSPWRRQLRPIRGIYHAVFTFFWGMNLFNDLDRSIQIDKTNFFKFSSREKLKIKLRYLEEYLMISYSLHDLKIALKMGKITKAGNEFVTELEVILKRDLNHFLEKKKELACISKSSYKKIINLEKQLLEASKTYRFKI